MGIPKENETTFFDETRLPNRNTSCHFFSFSAFPNYDKNPLCQKWNREFQSEYCDRNMWTTSRGDPKHSSWKEKIWSKFPESLALWKATTVYHTVDVPCQVAYIKNKSWRRSNSRISGFNKQAHVSLSLLSFFNFLSAWFEVKRPHRWIWLPSTRMGGVGGGVFPQGQISP